MRGSLLFAPLLIALCVAPLSSAQRGSGADENTSTNEAEQVRPGVFPGAEALGRAIGNMYVREWNRQRTPYPDFRDRPELSYQSDGEYVRLHSDEPFSETLLDELDGFIGYVFLGGFAPPLSDGGRGGSGAFDLYLAPEASMRQSYADAVATGLYFDQVSTFAVVDPLTAGNDLSVCAMEAYARALFQSRLPDEDPRWIHALAAWLTWQYSGRFGCADAADTQQREPFRGWTDGAADDGAGGALFLAMLSTRFGGGDGTFVRDLVELARQRTWDRQDGKGFRGTPDLWQALYVTLNARDVRFDDLLIDFAVERTLTAEGLKLGSLSCATREFPPMHVSFERDTTQALPAYSPTSEILQPYGSHASIIDVGDVDQTLYAWLRGEHGVVWGFVAVRLDDEGHSRGRVTAPTLTPRHGSFLTVELVAQSEPDENTDDQNPRDQNTDDQNTEHNGDERGNIEDTRVLLVSTNLSSRLTDADDEVNINGRALRIAVSDEEPDP